MSKGMEVGEVNTMVAFAFFGASLLSMYALGVWHTAVPGIACIGASLIYATLKEKGEKKYVFRIKSFKD